MNTSVDTKNFIIRTYELSTNMSEKAQKFITSASGDEKDLEKLWKGTNEAKQKKQQELAQSYKIMAYVSAACLVTSLACSIGGVTVNMRPGAGANGKLLGDLLTSIGDKGTSFGSQIASNLSQTSQTNLNMTIEKCGQDADKIWTADKRVNESRKEELKGLKEKLDSATRDLLEKSSMTYSTRG